jgi:penicillin amidase
MIGFNEKIAWGVTDGGADIKDWYKLNLTADHKCYELNGKWLPLQKRYEYISRRNKPAFVDTVYYSVFGPIVYDRQFKGPQLGLENFALRWALHSPSNELSTFMKINKAKNFLEFKKSFSSYGTPILNFTFASGDNSIAIFHRGFIENKSKETGKFLLNGTMYPEWSGFVNLDSLPLIFNPKSNYIVPAHLTSYNSDDTFYKDEFVSEIEAKRLANFLDRDASIDINLVMRLQQDKTNAFAVVVMPIINRLIDENQLNKQEKLLYDSIGKWGHKYDNDAPYAMLFNLWWSNITATTWDEFSKFPFYEKPPNANILLNLLKNDQSNSYFDLEGTTKKENAKDIVTNAFISAAHSYLKMKQVEDLYKDNLNNKSLAHLTGLELFNLDHLTAFGISDSLTIAQESLKPSWRMIVELGKRPKAYGMLSLGQSKGGGSNHEQLSKGERNAKYRQLNFYLSEDEAKKNAIATWNLKLK